ncbi:MAG: GNAT family N-acetyltransferase [Chromatiales bacterium]|nr:GNAT family N-acetyltransferase [Chromatiales bacterium]
MALETEHKRLDPADRRRRRARRARRSRPRVAISSPRRDGQRVGQLMITYEWSDWRNGTFWWIQSVYVLPEARRGGVFRALFAPRRAAGRARPGVCGIRLYVERENSARAGHLPALRPATTRATS